MKRELKEIIILTASYYNRTLSEPVLNMYAEDLEDLDPRAVVQAYKAWRQNPKNTQFPLPAQIRGLINPEIDEDVIAKTAASRIIEAVARFGWCNSQDARAHIGELGWSVVSRFGGWSYVCENMGRELNITTFQAQARDLAKAQAQLAKAGRLNEAPALPQPSGSQKQLTEVTKMIGRVKSVEEV